MAMQSELIQASCAGEVGICESMLVEATASEVNGRDRVSVAYLKSIYIP